MKNVVWVRPIIIQDRPVQVNIGIYPEDNGEIAYEIYTLSPETAEGEIVYSQGSALLTSPMEIPTIDLQAIQAQCHQKMIDGAKVYEIFQMAGVEYGPGHRGIQELYTGSSLVLAKLALPAAVSATKDQFILHPSMMDSALQATIGIMALEEAESTVLSLAPAFQPSLPFALEELEVFGKSVSTMWALIRAGVGSQMGDAARGQAGLLKLDIDLCDEQGNVCVRMKGYTARVLGNEAGLPAAIGSLMLEPVWKEQELALDQGLTSLSMNSIW